MSEYRYLGLFVGIGGLFLMLSHQKMLGHQHIYFYVGIIWYAIFGFKEQYWDRNNWHLPKLYSKQQSPNEVISE